MTASGPSEETDQSPEATQFDEEFLHNFGPLDPILVGSLAKCGAVSTRTGHGETRPLRVSVCPICLALTE